MRLTQTAWQPSRSSHHSGATVVLQVRAALDQGGWAVQRPPSQLCGLGPSMHSCAAFARSAACCHSRWRSGKSPCIRRSISGRTSRKMQSAPGDLPSPEITDDTAPKVRRLGPRRRCLCPPGVPDQRRGRTQERHRDIINRAGCRLGRLQDPLLPTGAKNSNGNSGGGRRCSRSTRMSGSGQSSTGGVSEIEIQLRQPWRPSRASKTSLKSQPS